jgi:hypothetical protein
MFFSYFIEYVLFLGLHTVRSESMEIFHVILLCFFMTAFWKWFGSDLGFQSTVSFVEVCAVHNSFLGLRYLSQF